MKVAYVVLHYISADDTIACVESILNNIQSEQHETDVVVVDNASPNHSLAQLQFAFQEYSNVFLLQSAHNVGFAKGNNLGFRYAKDSLHANFIVCINNDTVIAQANFTDVFIRKYFEKKYAVLGPDIITADGYHQNPGNKQSWNLQELRNYRLKKRIRILLSYLQMDSFVSFFIKKTKEVYLPQTLVGDVAHTILHGACFIFSPIYIAQFNGICPDTFLYWEEDILKLYADRYHFLMLYTSELQLYHKKGSATNRVLSGDGKRMRMRYRRLIASSVVYTKYKKDLKNVDTMQAEQA